MCMLFSFHFSKLYDFNLILNKRNFFFKVNCCFYFFILRYIVFFFFIIVLELVCAYSINIHLVFYFLNTICTITICRKKSPLITT